MTSARRFTPELIKTYPLFLVQIGNEKNRKIVFHPEATVIKYHQNLSNSFCLSSLSPAFHSIGDNRAATEPENCIEE